MPNTLVIVESPAKAKTLQKYLGRGYSVKASVGHVRDLPKSKIGVDLETFIPHYQTIKEKTKVLKELHDAAKKAEKVLLAPDPDREGEAIAWHIEEILKKDNPNIRRITFNEITKSAVLKALKDERPIDMNKVDSQQARRVLDRIVGYQISPILWDKVRRGLSAGRVQSVALRLVVEREREIQAFKPQEYWTLEVLLDAALPPSFKARLTHVDKKKVDLKQGPETLALAEEAKKAAYKVASLQIKERRRKAPPPYITSKLQQDAAARFGFSAARTMGIAQGLYEGVEVGDETVGLITYMRTDSVRLSNDALEMAREHIQKNYGKEYLPDSPQFYKGKSSAQDAHEAIRPTSASRTPEAMAKYLDADQLKLYTLIWKRFIACQMNQAVFDQTTAEIEAGRLTFRATGSVLKFDGYLTLYRAEAVVADTSDNDAAEKEENDGAGPGVLPQLKEGEKLRLKDVLPEQHFTQPPPRFSEGTLVKELEEQGIGRPSTYAQIMSTLLDKEYITRNQGRLAPTELGFIVSDLLVQAFPDVMNVSFTASMENRLDEIEDGKAAWQSVLKNFYQPFVKTLDEAKKKMKDVKRQETPTDVVCEKCGNMMVIKFGRNGSFLACSNYPECKNTKEFRNVNGKIEVLPDSEPTSRKCPTCGKFMVIRRGRFGKFLACSDYPTCKTAMPLPIGVACPKCKVGELVERRTKGKFQRVFYGCNRYPECDMVSWARPVDKKCPSCGNPYLVYKESKRIGPHIGCPVRGCGYHEDLPGAEPAASPAARAA
ncbi:MAG: DNA topoisomerase 1 [Myxococcota bacterium]|nr:DNA topoisomerase 1 [Myxococcota bacterium]